MTENKRGVRLLFPTIVQMTMLPDHEALNETLNHEVERVRHDTPNGRPESWSSDVYTTISNDYLLHQRPGFSRLTGHFLKQAEQYARALDYPMDRYGIHMDMCWLNAYTRGQSQERHTHINYVFAGIYYLKAPPSASKLIVHSPTSDTTLVPPARERTDLNTTFAEIEPREGMMLIFSGNLRHSVKASHSDEERISISMNANLAQRTS